MNNIRLLSKVHSECAYDTWRMSSRKDCIAATHESPQITTINLSTVFYIL